MRSVPPVSWNSPKGRQRVTRIPTLQCRAAFLVQFEIQEFRIDFVCANPDGTARQHVTRRVQNNLPCGTIRVVDLLQLHDAANRIES